LRKVWRDREKLLAPLERLEDAIAAEIEDLRIVRRQEIRRIPVEPQREVGRILLLLCAKLRDRGVHRRRRGPERIAAQGGDRVLPPAIGFLPGGFGNAKGLAGLHVAAGDAAALR